MHRALASCLNGSQQAFREGQAVGPSHAPRRQSRSAPATSCAASRRSGGRGWIGGTLVVLVSLVGGVEAFGQSDEADRIRSATAILEQSMAAPDRGVPASVFRDAEAVAVFPSVVEGAFIIGGHRGHGIISVRDRDRGEWSAPAFLTLTGGSFGFQIGGHAIDLLLVVRNRRGLESLLQNQFKIGADAGVVAGPVGRDAEAATDLQLSAGILSYSRSRGLFAGLSLQGSAIRQDRDANERFYGEWYRTRDIVLDRQPTAPATPEVVREWRAGLHAYEAREQP